MQRHLLTQMHSHTLQLQASKQSCPCCKNSIAENIQEPPWVRASCQSISLQQQWPPEKSTKLKTCSLRPVSSEFPYNERPLVILCVRRGRRKERGSGERKRQNLIVIITKPSYTGRWWIFMTGATAKLEDTAHKKSVQELQLNLIICTRRTHTETKTDSAFHGRLQGLIQL